MSCLLRLLGRWLAPFPAAYSLLVFLTGERAVVRGWSMYPALAPGERVLFDRVAYRLGPPRRGDIVLARHPQRPRLRIVKRVAAVPGDRFALEGDLCWVNGRPWGSEPPPGSAPEQRVLGPDQYLLLGDAPHLSTDGRHFGPVSRRQLIGRAWMVYWPAGRVRRLGGA